MPLFESKSKKAFKHNIEAEMEAGKPQKQSLAIAYDVKRRNAHKKKMAQGGYVNDSAKTEHKPMPEERDQDSKMVGHNSSDKAPKHDSWTDRSTEAQAKKPSHTKLSRPSLKGSDAFSVRYQDEIDEDLKRLSSMPPESPEAEPSRSEDEEESDRQGPKVHPMKMMAKGGEVEMIDSSEQPEEENEEEHHDSMAAAIMAKRGLKRMEADAYADGGEVKPRPTPSDMSFENIKNAFSAPKPSPTPDASQETRSKNVKKYGIDKVFQAKGGLIGRYAEGGEVDIEENAEEEPNSYLERNKAILKENYDDGMSDLEQPEDSNERGDEREDETEDKHDAVSSIMKKMKSRKQF